MPYREDDSAIKCNPDDLYHGDLLHEGYDESDFAPIVEGRGTLMAANVPFVNFSEGTVAIGRVRPCPPPPPPVQSCTDTLPDCGGFIDRMCGD